MLALLLSIYGLAVFGYITASFATFFIGQEAAAPDGDLGGAREIAALRADIIALREELQRSPGR
jgi:voltage-gated potassium channel